MAKWVHIPCSEGGCERHVVRTETRWESQFDEWVPVAFVTVCSEGHRVEVPHFD